MTRESASPRRRRRSLTALLPAALVFSVLLAAPVLGGPLVHPGVFADTGGRGSPAAPARPKAAVAPAPPAGPSVGRPVQAAHVRPAAAAANRPRWSFSRGALGVLVLTYVGIGALAAAGIWSYVRRGRW